MKPLFLLMLHAIIVAACSGTLNLRQSASQAAQANTSKSNAAEPALGSSDSSPQSGDSRAAAVPDSELSEVLNTSRRDDDAATKPCRLESRVLAGSSPSEVAGTPLDYQIYLPPCYGLDGLVYPTLYIFAGNVHDEHFWDEAGLDEAAEEAIVAGEIPPMLIVMPDGGYVANNTSGGPLSYESMILQELIPYIEENYCAWKSPAGRAIGGLSRGGYWALEIAFRNADMFAGVGGHSASLLDSAAGPDRAPESTVVQNELGDLQIYLDIGEDDWLRSGLEGLHETMEAADISHTWILNEGAHVNEYWAEHAPEYIAWYAGLMPVERKQYPTCDQSSIR